MFQSGAIALELSHWTAWLAQAVPVEPETVEEVSVVSEGPQFFTALIAGVLLALAFQLLLTNLGLALGISLAGGSSDSDRNRDTDKASESFGHTIQKIGNGLGAATLFSVTISLFLACLFAVRLSLLVSPGLGAIMGLVIWATFFSLLFWFSSSTVGGFVGSIINAATSGLQSIMGTAVAAIGGGAASRQMVATAEAAAGAVRREFTSAIDPVTIRENVEEYLQALRPAELDVKTIRSEFENILKDPNLKQIAGSVSAAGPEGLRLRTIDRQTFVDLVSSRSDLSKQDVNRLADQLEAAWQQAVNQSPQRDSMAELVDYLKSATPAQLGGQELTRRLDELAQELRLQRQGQPSQDQQNQGNTGPIAQAMTFGINSLIGMVMGRTDLSDLDVEKVVGQLKKVQGQVGDQANKLAAQASGGTVEEPFSTVRADVENYLLNKYSWQMNRQTLEREFRDVLYDAEADPSALVREVEQLNRSDFANLLQQRGLFTQDEIRELADTLESVRLEVLNTAIATRESAHASALMTQVEQYLLTTPKADLTPEKIQLNLRPILEDPDTDYEYLNARLTSFDRATFEELLRQRQDLTPDEANAITNELESARDRVLSEGHELQEAAKAKAEAQWLKVKSYLRDTGRDELNPQDIERELKLLLDDPQSGVAALRTRASHFDRETLVQLLSQRQDLSEDQVNRVLDQVQGNWTRIRYTPQKLAGQAKEQYDQATSAITQYLRNTGKDELNPEGIQRDLNLLLNDPKLGAEAIRQRLASMDRDTLVKLLSQRQDLSEDQVNQVIDQVQGTLRSVIRAPRRLATRTQAQVQDFQATVADYLRSTGKDELNPDGIQRDIQLLLSDPRAGAQSLGDRLAHFDRSTLVALLSQREDISEADVNRIADQIVGVRDQLVGQMQNIQQRVQSVIDSVFERIRAYLNSLERPELNYEGIRSDLRTLFDDPQAGFEALRDRLSQFDRDTLVAVLSSREDISEADANRLIDQVEGTRTRVLQRAERLQLEAQRRLDEVKHQAQRQADEVRKAAASAARWLFFTGITSAVFSALAGYLGVVD